MKKNDVGIIGLAVMGGNLARNISDKGFKTVVYNRTAQVTKDFIDEFGNDVLSGIEDLKEFVESLSLPRKIILMVKAGEPVDQVIEQLIPLLSNKDIILDFGNSNFKDTIRRTSYLKEKNLIFIGCGISGGEIGALNGPSLMPGGSDKAWIQIEPILKAIAAKDFNNDPCVTHISTDGAGHYVKMVHNGIEYGIMELLAETYQLFRVVYGLSPDKISKIFARYNKDEDLNSYLMEISSVVLAKKDELTKDFLINKILDKAEQKGTGKWTAIDALERDIDIPLITESVFARVASSKLFLRQKLSKQYPLIKTQKSVSIEEFSEEAKHAIYLAMLISYAQGLSLIQKAEIDQNWDIDLSELTRIWQGGCIIRAKVLIKLTNFYKNKENQKKHLFEIIEFQNELKKNIKTLREIVVLGVQNGVALPAYTSALTYFDSYTTSSSSANLIQGLRDLFGAHTYERIDRKGSFHMKWEK